MNYADIRPIDVANGPGIRVSLFVSGCTHACPGCFNPEAWDFQYGRPFTRAEAAAICRMGLERMETDLAIRQGYLQKLREEFTQLKEKTDGHKTENL